MKKRKIILYLLAPIFGFFLGINLTSKVPNVKGASTNTLTNAIIGSIQIYSGTSVPTGYLECNGQLVSRTDYSELFEMIGTAWGEGDGSTTFAVPDMRKRVPVGLDTSDEDFDTIGKIGGEKEHTLTIDEMPSHKHGYDYDQTQGSNTGGLKTGTNNVYGGTTKATGGGQPHNIMQPYTVTCYIIKAKMGATVTKGNIIDSLDGESKIDAPSVNAVNNGLKTNIITGSEIATNEYIDGKRVYIKAFNFTSINDSMFVSTDIDIVRDIKCNVKDDSTNGNWRPIPWLYNTLSNTDYYGGVSLNSSNGKIVFQVGTGLSTMSKGYVEVHYTKN